MISPEKAIAWLAEAARYFEARDTRGEDAAHWANVANAETCRRIGRLIGKQCAEVRPNPLPVPRTPNDAE